MEAKSTASPINGAGASTPRSRRYREKRKLIVDAAVPLLNDKGVWGMTLQEVAQALDLTTTSVTYYYRYKEQLAAAVFEDTMSRLSGMVREAAEAPTPKERVARYAELYLDQFACARRGQGRPLAVLSEMRTLEESVRDPLIRQYQEVFRAVRELFGPADTQERKRTGAAKAQFLNEALFWSAMWLRRYPLGDLHNIRRRFLDILENGIVAPGSAGPLKPVALQGCEETYARREFLRVASRLINDIGYKGASVDRIVGDLKITKGSFYHHLAAKDDLILGCYRHDYARLRVLFTTMEQAELPVSARLAGIVATAMNWQFEGDHPLLRTTALQAMPVAVRGVGIEWFDRTAHLLSGFLVDGMREGSIRIIDPMIAGHVTISTINSAYDLRSWAGKQQRDQAIGTYAGLLMNGLFPGT